MKSELTKNPDEMSQEELKEALRYLQTQIETAKNSLTHERSSSHPPDRDSLFRLLTESSRDMISRNTADGIVLYVSPAVTWLLGYSPDEVVGRPATEFVHPEDKESFRLALHDATEKGAEEFSVEHRMRKKDGTAVWTETRGVLFLSVTGELIEIHCSVRNIDDRKSAEQKVIMMTSAIESMGLPVYWMNRDGRFVYVNQAACDALKYTKDELCLLHVWEIDPDFTEERWQAARLSLEKERHQRFETTHLAKDGRVFPVEIISDFSAINGEGVHWAFARDISREKGTEESIRQMEQRLRQAEKMEAIGLLAGGIAHDFNNQLAGLLGYADLLRDDVKDPTLVEYIDSIMLGIKRASGLTEQLLAFSRRGKYLSLPVNMNTIIKEVGSILRHSIDKKITIRNRLCQGEAVTTGDPSQLQNAVLNLAINARDAMPDGGTLTFYTEKLYLDQGFCDMQPYEMAPGPYIRVSVADTGIGMSAEVQQHAFEPFFTTKEPGKGTGMGLAAVYGTVKNHKGAINIYSEQGRGTEVKMYLPAAEGTAAQVDENSEISIPPRTLTRVLLVEDEAVLTEVVTAMLKRMGCIVSVCKNGQEAVSAYEASWSEIDLVILDMVMPVMNGREAFSAMKRINPNVTAILASGYSLDGDAQALMNEGVRGFVQKPYRKKDLARAIAEALNLRS
jgi:PAS domain S-box-containing protein